MRGHGDYTLLGKTRDDAAGEAFDKAARILGLGYPGGPAIDKASQNGKPCLVLPYAWLTGTHDFSFSGIKTALYRMVEDGKVSNVNDAAASFQEAVVYILAVKTIAAAKEHGVKQILMSGGVASNRSLRRRLGQESHVPVLIPGPILCTDNAAMVAACGYFRLQAGGLDGLDMDVIPGLRMV
jgi:N6-L-threonylcarbamoyladenine synthase